MCHANGHLSLAAACTNFPSSVSDLGSNKVTLSFDVNTQTGEAILRHPLVWYNTLPSRQPLLLILHPPKEHPEKVTFATRNGKKTKSHRDIETTLKEDEMEQGQERELLHLYRHT